MLALGYHVRFWGRQRIATMAMVDLYRFIDWSLGDILYRQKNMCTKVTFNRTILRFDFLPTIHHCVYMVPRCS
jgi:hypothetical protein